MISISWFVLALAGTCLYAGVTFVDKYIIEKLIDDYRGLVGVSSLIALSIGLLAFILNRDNPIVLVDILFLITSGALIVASTFIYFYVISKDHVSFVTVFFQVIPIFVILFAHFLLGEQLSLVQMVGAIVVVIAGMALVFVDQNTAGFGWTIHKSSVVLMIIYDVLWALAAMCIKLSGPSVQFSHILIYESLGMGAVGLFITFIIRTYRRAFQKLLTSVPKKHLLVLIGNEGILYLMAKLSMNYAYRIGLAGLVSVVESMQILVAVVAGFALGTLWPKIFKENTARSGIFRKLVFGMFMIFGLWLLH